MGGKWVRVPNFIVNLSYTSYMRGVFILVVVPKDNKLFSMYREIKVKTTSKLINIANI